MVSLSLGHLFCPSDKLTIFVIFVSSSISIHKSWSRLRKLKLQRGLNTFHNALQYKSWPHSDISGFGRRFFLATPLFCTQGVFVLYIYIYIYIYIYNYIYNHTTVLYSRDRYEIIGLRKILHSIKQPCGSICLKKS